VRAAPFTDADARWDLAVASSDAPHITQTTGWAQLKALTGWGSRRFQIQDDDGTSVGLAQVLTKPLPLGITVAYAPRGPLVTADRLAPAIGALRVALASERCASLLCDPEVPPSEAVAAELKRSGIQRSPIFVQPRRTLLMDLRLDPDALQAAMRKKTRQYIHKAERAGVVTEETRDLDRFLAVLRIVGERDRFALHSRAYFERILTGFGERALVMMARVGSEDVGAMMLVRMGGRAWELYGGWSGAHDEARPFYLLKWHAMMRMRALGAMRYDMWGLADRPSSDPAAKSDDPLAGVENFKLGFGGEVVEWIGALETAVRPMLYPLWQLGARRRLARSAA
jgi:lipid II:glycine glycyltransferase (peptidoglycan interpeptide bridge formation enzyme)